MEHRRRALLTVTFLTGIAIVGGQSLAGSFGAATNEAPNGPAQIAPQAEKPAEQVYKNIQVFKGLPASQLAGAMAFMSASLGVACNHCHVADWESDENAAKQSARRMIEMMRGINKQNYGASPVITCYTCHRGSPDPASAPDASDLSWQHASEISEPVTNRASLPSTDALIDRYYQALGGRKAVYNVKTMVLKGERTTTNRINPPMTARFEELQAGPDRSLLNIFDSNGAYSYLVNGSDGWFEQNGNRRPMTAGVAAERKRDPGFMEFLRLAERFPGIRVFAKEKLGDREVYSVGASTSDGNRQKLYFDVVSGLLVRRVVTIKTVLGSLPEITEFVDYRVVEGIKLPFRITWSRPPFSVTRVFTDIRLNVAIDESKFHIPR